MGTGLLPLKNYSLQNEFKFAEREFAFRSLKEDGFLQLGAPDDALFQNFVDTTDLTNKGKLNEVRKAIEQNNLLLAETKNASIASNNILEENRKQVNDIYLKTMAVNKLDFDAMQIATLESIACQDALEGGEAVYSARVMLRMNGNCSSAKMAFVNEEENYDENKTILQEVKSFSVGNIYPNPNDGNMQLDYQLESGQIGVLIIHDILGQEIKKYSFENDRNTLKISEAVLKNGIYFYEVLINNEIISSEKLIIIR